MRRAVLITLGIGEVFIAGVLSYLGFSLPSPAEVQTGFAMAERVTMQASTQVSLLRRQMHTLRQFELRGLAERLRHQTHNLTQLLRAQPVDFSMVGTVRDALDELASGLSGLSETLDPVAVGRLGSGLKESATFLEEVAAPAVIQAAGNQEKGKEADALLKDLATTLRTAAKGMDATATRWPELQTTLRRLAKLLRAACDDLNVLVRNRHEYETMLRQTLQLADNLAMILPLTLDQFTGQLEQQDQALDEMERSIEDFSMLLPAYGRTATQLVQVGRLLTWLVAGFVLVHAIYLVSNPTSRRELATEENG